MKKDAGTGMIYYVFFLALIGMLSLLASFVIRIKMISNVNENVQDAVTLSNLASALIDIEKYSNSGVIQVKDINHSYLVYEDAMKVNLNLTEEMEPKSSQYIQSKIDILEYSVYNVIGSDIVLTQKIFHNGVPITETLIHNGQVGVLMTPDGVMVTNTTIYSKIGFLIRGYRNRYHYVYKEGSVDIVDH